LVGTSVWSWPATNSGQQPVQVFESGYCPSPNREELLCGHQQRRPSKGNEDAVLHPRHRGNINNPVPKKACHLDYEIEFDIWSKGNNCAASDIIAGRGRKIWGVIYEIPDQLIRRDTAKPRKSLDAIEGEGTNYQRVQIKLNQPDGRPINEQVITYIGNDHKTGIQTTWDYVQHILMGLEEHQMPDEYKNYVKARIIANNPELKSMLPI
jgi:gamma-glutamylcyclotransferase (GGCT)/AIG2-like uncharacterized protein YtfP